MVGRNLTRRNTEKASMTECHDNRANHVREGWRGRQGLGHGGLVGLSQRPGFHSCSSYLFRDDTGRS